MKYFYKFKILIAKSCYISDKNVDCLTVKARLLITPWIKKISSLIAGQEPNCRFVFPGLYCNPFSMIGIL